MRTAITIRAIPSWSHLGPRGRDILQAMLAVRPAKCDRTKIGRLPLMVNTGIILARRRNLGNSGARAVMWLAVRLLL